MREGLRLPSVELPATTGGSIDLSTLEERALLVLYPWTGRPGTPNPPRWDDIPGAHGSTPELEGFRDSAERFENAGIAIFGLSRQDTAWQRELAERLSLSFPLLSDVDDKLWPALGAPTFETGGEIYLKRATLLVENGQVAAVFADIADPAGHATDLLQRLLG
ncbi:putative peroxiredoxin bcp [Methyloligella halotolerans]|uniref:thioredoxin-dependent peroxiredoxin n=1 Tax=Methyloligella halotolerans TaxID=1177755 RepID=A0A1E2S2E3_9HYPH|nr:peroxiredoxin [Methyloligella halotolerans]ODA68604.1 putative peroxiredoxin bcp [Methyloligella halotolerans]